MKRQNKGGFHEPPSVFCADGIERPAWKFVSHTLYFLIRPGTPILRCDECGARVCLFVAQGESFDLDLASSLREDDDLNAHYAPEHFCDADS